MFWKIAVLENIEQFLGMQPSKMFSFGFCDIYQNGFVAEYLEIGLLEYVAEHCSEMRN